MERTKTEKTRTFRIAGQLNGSFDELDHCLANGERNLEIDFTACTRITVEGLEWLEELLLRADSLTAKVSLVNIPSQIYKVFKVAQIDIILRSCGSPMHISPGAAAC